TECPKSHICTYKNDRRYAAIRQNATRRQGLTFAAVCSVETSTSGTLDTHHRDGDLALAVGEDEEDVRWEIVGLDAERLAAIAQLVRAARAAARGPQNRAKTP
ncbi:hypothetical protein, partial [Gulosibacter sediminis]|uniref:hypothetical protein n=1 Tax=Gulosibacter sediminis TaxID=1729695 RepID=UPI001B7D863E